MGSVLPILTIKNLGRLQIQIHFRPRFECFNSSETVFLPVNKLCQTKLVLVKPQNMPRNRAKRSVLKLRLVTPWQFVILEVMEVFKNNEIYTQPEIQKIMKIDMKTLTSLISRGVFIKPMYAGKNKRFLGRDLNNYLKRKIVKKKPERFTKEKLEERLVEYERSRIQGGS